jgi:thiol-disulfide isomerase/thioredoxin
MNRILIISPLIIFVLFACNENQVPNKAADTSSDDPLFYINNVYGYWSTERFDTAIIYVNKLMELEPRLVVDMLHQEVALGISEDDPAAYGFVKRLKSADIQGLNIIIEPIYIWSQIHNVNKEDSLLYLFDELTSALEPRLLSNGKPELYILKTLNDFELRGIMAEQVVENICNIIIEKLEKNLDVNNYLEYGNSQVKRAYIRIILSNAYYILSKYNNREANLKMAAYYSPDNTDKQNIQGYFYTSVILTGDYKNFGFQQKYLDYLLKYDRNHDALSVLANMTLNEPIDDNINKFRTHLAKLYPSQNFKEYWHSLVSEHSELFPDLSFLTIDSTTLSSKSFIGQWTLIDVWGTWCEACVAELPALEAFYRESLINYNNQMHLLTLSANSKNLFMFMKQNNYTFPVAEIDKNVVNELKINGFPTKLLISPEGKYRIIPFNANWIEYINNYCLIEKRIANKSHQTRKLI